ncbi:SAYSvFN domain-containing protein 1 [Macrosteles quadrilineatus]|uniref:SAYSvFN domain-containing protein 1 n=1 Tax=Macrosteles quadrilineatus TaxID=74068 RepID=UPI0023E2ECD7|nr:SAYSvFN domain-containing protein 1 [Macrosteles quadrilineatus]
MDEKLARYRSKKRREEFIQLSKEKIFSFLKVGTQKHDMVGDEVELTIKDQEEEVESKDDNASISSLESADESECCDEFTYSKFSLYASLWLILFSFAIYLEFGAIYFIVSGFYIIWANTRTGPKRRGEVSAYSVFNPDCEAIDGTLKPEQFEREIRYGFL